MADISFNIACKKLKIAQIAQLNLLFAVSLYIQPRLLRVKSYANEEKRKQWRQQTFSYIREISNSHVFANPVRYTIYFIFQYSRCKAIFMEMLWNKTWLLLLLLLLLWAFTLITFTIIIIINRNPTLIKKTSKRKTTWVI